MSAFDVHASDPIAIFLGVRSRAEAVEPWGATAAVLATADARGRPSARVVLVKEVEPDGLYFYTNERSRKAIELAANPFAALCFYWPSERAQFRFEGPVEKASPARSDAYFAGRPRGSQLGAWASEQSRPLASREELEARVREFDARYANQPVPRPPHWGGYRLIPERVEHWIEGPHRLHDRFLYERTAAGWSVVRLFP